MRLRIWLRTSFLQSSSHLQCRAILIYALLEKAGSLYSLEQNLAWGYHIIFKMDNVSLALVLTARRLSLCALTLFFHLHLSWQLWSWCFYFFLPSDIAKSFCSFYAVSQLRTKDYMRICRSLRCPVPPGEIKDELILNTLPSNTKFGTI